MIKRTRGRDRYKYHTLEDWNKCAQENPEKTMTICGPKPPRPMTSKEWWVAVGIAVVAGLVVMELKRRGIIKLEGALAK